MAHDFDEFAEDLKSEVLSEMADSFFGERKRIEQTLERIDSLALELKEAFAKKVVPHGRLLHHLLLDDREVIAAFYRELGVRPEPFLDAIPAPKSGERPAAHRPFAFTNAGRLAKMGAKAYKALQEALEDYVSGVYYPDPANPQKKKVTPHLDQLKALCARVNARIENMNTYQTPSCALNYMRSLDPDEIEKRKLTGATFEDACNIDEAMAFEKKEFASLGMDDLPDLPPPEEAARKVKEFFVRLHKERGHDVAEMLKTLDNA